MKIHSIPQGTEDWFSLRIGKVTASELKNLVTPDFKPRTGKTPQTYLYSKLAEVWRGKPQFSAGSWSMEQGNIRQDFAIPFLAIEKDWQIRSGDFIESDDGLSGCSPDGLVGDDMGVEVKCPEPTNHVRWFIEGGVPDEYITQVHHSLYVSGFRRWMFMSYHVDFPPLIVEVERDEEICEKIESAVLDFHEKLNAAKKKMESIE